MLYVSASDNLAFSEAAAHPGNVGFTVSLTGVLGTQAAGLANFELGNGLATNGLTVHISETLNFTEVASYPIVNNSVSESLVFTETATAGRIVNVRVSDAITFSEADPVIGPQYKTAAGRLNLSELASGHLTLQNVSVSDVMQLLDVAARRLGVSVSDVMALAESTKPHPNAADVLAFIEAVLVAKSQGLADSINFTEAVSVLGSFGQGVTDAMVIAEAASFYLDSASLCTYAPAIGSAVTGYTPPSATPPTLGAGTLTLTYPYVSPTTTLVLRNPDWGNEDKRTYTRLNQTTRGGTLTVFADPQWPKFKTLTVQLTAITDDMRTALLQFLQDSIGQIIGLLDWEGRQWSGLITNPDTAVTQAGQCNHGVSIEFEGDLA